MDIRTLGAHNCETKKTRCVSLLIDGILALDAGGLTSSLTIAQQKKLKALLITHYHYDHTRDIPALGMNLFLNLLNTNLYATQVVHDTIVTYLLNGDSYPKFMERPAKKPTFNFNLVEPLKGIQIEDYCILPVTVNHAVPGTGYQITSADGKKVFYTGDTGPDLITCWKEISPDLLIIEVTMPNRWEDSALRTGHLTANLLKKELVIFRNLKGYTPQIIAIHMNPYLESEIEAELTTVAEILNAPISLAHEGMKINL